MANFKLACIVLMCMALLYAQNGYAITCGQVVSNFVPCIDYLQNGGPLTAHCCNGVRAIFNAAARTPLDFHITCNCMKSGIGNFKRINRNKLASLPGKCGVIHPSINLASIKCGEKV